MVFYHFIDTFDIDSRYETILDFSDVDEVILTKRYSKHQMNCHSNDL